MQRIIANFTDIPNKKIYPARIEFNHQLQSIVSLGEEPNPDLPFLLPGFIDAHVHIESSMLIPAEFARIAVTHGTVATVSDPHEIANVCGVEGVDFMVSNGLKTPFKFNFGAPSCVPATIFETAGASIDSLAVKKLLASPHIKYLSEMMNFPGALQGDPEVLEKIASARALDKPVDGHAPGLRGEMARNYIERGISTDHECFTLDEALDKLQYGMKIIIREGSAARNFEALFSLIDQYPEMVMFGSDDKHPDELVAGHINLVCKRAIAKGMNIFNVLGAACINPVKHYHLDVGILQVNDPADFILVDNLHNFSVQRTYINGQCVAENGKSMIPRLDEEISLNQFHCMSKNLTDIECRVDGPYVFPVIEALDGQLITNKLFIEPKNENGYWVSDTNADVLKIAVVNRYRESAPAIGFIKNFGLKQGAIASSVAHDSHNIVAVGADDESLLKAINMIINNKGGISCVKDNLEMVLPLPVGGLMSSEDGYKVAELYGIIDKAAKDAGSTLRSPFMTLSFMALLVIPHVKLSDLGLFDGDRFGLM
jgi:adenine deaminase